MSDNLTEATFDLRSVMRALATDFSTGHIATPHSDLPYSDCAACIRDTLLKAADKIEEQQREIERLAEVVNDKNEQVASLQRQLQAERDWAQSRGGR